MEGYIPGCSIELPRVAGVTVGEKDLLGCISCKLVGTRYAARQILIFTSGTRYLGCGHRIAVARPHPPPHCGLSRTENTLSVRKSYRLYGLFRSRS
jgi:hypothetical protein